VILSIVGLVFLAGKNIKYMVFFGLIIAILALIYFAISYADLLVANLFWLIVLVIFVYIIWKYDFIVQLLDYQRVVIYRFGKVNRVGGPGWAFLWPLIEDYALVDLRVKTIDVPKQEVVTKDGIEITLDAIVYLRVKKDNQSVVNSIIEVEDYANASSLFITASLRDIVGSMTLSDIISNIIIINMKMKDALEKVSKNWGITIDSIEISDIQIPDVVLNAMHEEKAAVQQKLARMERALAHKAEIDAVQEAASKLDDKALAYYYIKAIDNMGNSKGSKIFFPSEFSRLAETFSNSGMLSGQKTSPAKTSSDKSTYYKQVLKQYVDGAVKKAKQKEHISSVSKKKKKKK